LSNPGQKFIGFEANVLYNIIGISRDVFNQWKRLLDVEPRRNNFNQGDFIAYWAIYRLCGHGQHRLSKLSGQKAWEEIFDACYNMPLDELEKCSLACYWSSSKLVFLRAGQRPSEEDEEAYHLVSFQRILKAYRNGNEILNSRGGDIKDSRRLA